MQGGAGSNTGGTGIKKDIGPKRERGALLGLRESEPNRSGSSEPNRFRISYLKACSGFFLIFSFSFSLFLLSRERGSAFSLEIRQRALPSSPASGRFRRGGRRAAAAAPPRRS